MSKLAKQYDPAEHEPQVYKQWEQSGAFQPSKDAIKAGRKPYVIMLPPPNITGSLHMGHALQDTIMDILVRYHRMKGEPTLWLPGTDHAAIATNKVLEDQLASEGTSRHEIGRAKFLQRAAQWYEQVGAIIINQMKRLGASCDWSRQRFTLDQPYVRAVQEAFVQYYKRGYIYRGSRLVNWDPSTQTTVSDIEIEWVEEKASLYTFQYGPFQISTARPETKFGDKYVVIHPDDERYAEYKHGQTFTCEWINGPVTATIIKDEIIDRNFGSGVMTITPWHDATDYEIAERHQLDKEPIIGLDGRLLPIAGEFAGMTIAEARPKIVAKLKDKGLLVGIDDSYVHRVAVNQRGKGVIEPQVSRQWFINMSKLKQEAIEAVKAGLITFHSQRWQKHFLDWMEQVRDWNINRQIWLGHRLPVWWKPGTHGTDNEEGNYVVSIEKPAIGLSAEVRQLADEGWEQDPDVLDTWFSSALWPFATLGWPEATEHLKTFYPTSVLVTARDILYLWVARMIFSGLELMKGKEFGDRPAAQRIPFRDVFIHPTVLAKTGQRMSKSLGTGLDPLELIETYGADATRFGLMYQMNYDAQAIKFDEAAIRAARNFGNKLWNLARLLQLLPASDQPTVADRWIEDRLRIVAGEVTKLLDTYHLGEAARLLHDFVWGDFADWYVEILKVQGSTQIAKRVFAQMLALLHPFVPHLTEVVWRELGGQGLLILAAWPGGNVGVADDKAAAAVAHIKDVVTTIRSARALLGIAPHRRVSVYVERAPDLPAVVEVLARATLMPEVTAEMKQFPLAGGGVVSLGSVDITPQSVKRAQRKLQRQQQELSQFVARQEKALAAMRGKAPAGATAAKERSITDAKQRLTHIAVSLKLLT